MSQIHAACEALVRAFIAEHPEQPRTSISAKFTMSDGREIVVRVGDVPWQHKSTDYGTSPLAAVKP